MIKKHIVVWVCFLLSSLSAFAQFTVEVDTQAILVGEPLELRLYLEGEKGDSVVWPLIEEGLQLKKLEVLSTQPIDTTLKNNHFLLKQLFTITSFDSGVWAVPPFQAILNGDTLETSPFIVEVSLVQADSTEQFMPIKDPYEVPVTFKEWITKNGWILGTIAGVALLAFIGYKVWKNRVPTEKEPVKEEVQVAPYLWALEQLEALNKEALWQQGNHKEFHVRWSEVFREFLERQYQIPALESTTEEIKILLRRVDLAENHKNQLIEAFKIADLVKFARTVPLANENEFCFQVARNIAEEVKQQEELKLSKSAENG